MTYSTAILYTDSCYIINGLISVVQSGVLSAVVKELKGLVRTQLLQEAQGQCSACGGKAGDEDAKLALEKEVHKALEFVDKISSELTETKDQLKAKVSTHYSIK